MTVSTDPADRRSKATVLTPRSVARAALDTAREIRQAWVVADDYVRDCVSQSTSVSIGSYESRGFLGNIVSERSAACAVQKLPTG